MKRLLLLAAVGLVITCAGEPETFDELVQAGERAFVGGEYFKARGYFQAAVKQKPSDRRLLYLLGLTYSRELMFDSATFYLGRADILYPNDREVNKALVEAALNCEEFEMARKAILVLVRTGDPIENYLETLAELSLEINNTEWAHYYYRQLLEREPDNPNRYVQVGNTAADLGSLNVALGIVDSAIEKFGPNESLLSNKGIYLAAQKKYEQAEGIFRSLLAADSTAAPYYINLASALAGQKDRAKKEEALELFRGARGSMHDPSRIDSIIKDLEQELGR